MAARPTRDAVETFMNVTGASETLARRQLEECGGDLNDALNAHFNEWDGHITNPTPSAAPQYDTIDTNNQTNQSGTHGSLLPLFSAIRSFNPLSLLEPNFRRNLLSRIGVGSFPGCAPFVSHPREVREIPIGFGGGTEQSRHSGLRPVENVNDTSVFRNPEFHGNVVNGDGNEQYFLTGSHGNEVEEEMIQAAIDASMRDTETNPHEHFSVPNYSAGSGLSQRQPHMDDEEFARAISLSLKTAQQEKEMHEKQVKDREGSHDSSGRAGETNNSRWKGYLKPGRSLNQGRAEDVSNHDNDSHTQHSGDAFYSDKWGGISSNEYDEAVMLEAALFGGTSEGASHGFSNAPHLQNEPDGSVDPNPGPVGNPLSPSSMAQQLLQAQQNDEYLSHLLSDSEKEASAAKEAETNHLKGEESHLKMLEGKEFERTLVAKEASLPREPALDDENAVTLLVRMPDGSRHSRRFLKSDKLQLLFDFIDICGALKDGTYKVVRPYPRHAFSVGDSRLSLNQLGLTNKQEALFLELI